MNQEQKIQRLQVLIDQLINQLMVRQAGFLDSQAGTISQVDLKVIAFIGSRGTVIMREISDHLAMPLSTLTGVTDRLVRRGLVKRERTDEDRRVVRISLSDDGLAIYREEQATHRLLSQGMLAALNESEQEELIRLIGKITSSDR